MPRGFHGVNLVHGDLELVGVSLLRDRSVSLTFTGRQLSWFSCQTGFYGYNPRPWPADIVRWTTIEVSATMFVPPELLVFSRFVIECSTPALPADIYAFRPVAFQLWAVFQYSVQAPTGGVNASAIRFSNPPRALSNTLG